MNRAPFTVDGVAYDVTVPMDGLKRSFEVLDGKNAGRLLSGRMVRDIIGTYYNYELQIETQDTGKEAYDALYQALSAPVDAHTVTFPYGQETLTFRAYVSSGSDTLRQVYRDKNYWHGLSVKFIAEAPQRT